MTERAGGRVETPAHSLRFDGNGGMWSVRVVGACWVGLRGGGAGAHRLPHHTREMSKDGDGLALLGDQL